MKLSRILEKVCLVEPTLLAMKMTHPLQWIHTDPKRCAVESPFKSTIAHGFHTLSFSPKVMYDLMEVKNIAMMINYGTDKV